MEYLKNIIFHFMCSDSYGREQMVFPIATILHLSPDEVYNVIIVHMLKYCYCTALSSYSQGIRDGWLVCPSPHLLAKSTKSFAHPNHIAIWYSGLLNLILNNSIVTMVGWPLLPPHKLPKV